MIRSGLDPKEDAQPNDISRGGNLVMVSIATSIDALAVGLSMAMLEVNVIGASLVIGVVTLTLSMIGMRAGNLLGKKFGKRMEILGGLILIGIGLRILVTHLYVPPGAGRVCAPVKEPICRDRPRPPPSHALAHVISRGAGGGDGILGH